jgi:hypothetical protein
MSSAVAVVVLAAVSAGAAGDVVRSEAVGLRYAVAKSWERVPAASDMRAAQFRLPRAPGDTDDGDVVLYFFGPGQGGDPQGNLERWYGQFEQPDGRPSREAATVTRRTVSGLSLTVVDLAGTYSARMGPMHPAPPKPGWRMLAAVVEGPGGPWFWKAVGPERTIAAARSDFDALLASLEPHPRGR